MKVITSCRPTGIKFNIRPFYEALIVISFNQSAMVLLFPYFIKKKKTEESVKTDPVKESAHEQNRLK